LVTAVLVVVSVDWYKIVN